MCIHDFSENQALDLNSDEFRRSFSHIVTTSKGEHQNISIDVRASVYTAPDADRSDVVLLAALKNRAPKYADVATFLFQLPAGVGADRAAEFAVAFADAYAAPKTLEDGLSQLLTGLPAWWTRTLEAYGAKALWEENPNGAFGSLEAPRGAEVDPFAA